MLIVFPRAFVTSTTFTSSVFLSSHDFKKIRKRVFFGLLSKGSSIKIHISKMFVKFRE